MFYPTYPTPTLPVRWVTTPEALTALCAELGTYGVIALDCETTLTDRRLCLAQIATADFVALIDAVQVRDISELGAVLSNKAITKLIHYASFERSVFAKHGIVIHGVVDTLIASRKLRGHRLAGGHSLKAVCERELGVSLDKSQQTSDWTRRPLTAQQVAYAAMDAEVLLRLWRRWAN